jgi:hypothetical protein
VYEGKVAPVIAVPFFRHWYVNGAEPVAVTENTTFAPGATAAANGWTVITGGTNTFINTVAVAEPTAFLTVTV